MVAQFTNTSNDFRSQLLVGLKLIPPDWALIPVLGNKNPYRTDWHKEIPISHQQLAGLIEGGDRVISKDGKQRNYYPQGYGLRTGKWSNGILAVDADGRAAHERLNQLGGLPRTVSFTSGKPGRCQYLVGVPQEYWSVIETRKINTGIKGDNGKDQLLEFRWNGCQSVLPPSVHPETGSYKWVNSPQDCEIAFCPTWIIEYFLNESTPTTATLLTDDIPLYQCLTKDDRDLIDHAVGEGSRDDNGAKLARNLIGTAARLNHLGYRFVGEARQLFDDYCARCCPTLSARDAERIWQSAEKSNPSATLTDEALLNCIKAWRRHQNINIKQQQTTQATMLHRTEVITATMQNAITSSTPNEIANEPDNVVLHPTVNIPYSALKAEYIELLESGTSKSELSRFKTEVNKKYYPLRLDIFLKDVETEYHTTEEDEIIKEDIQQLLDCANLELDIRKFLPTKLATALMLFGINQSLPQTSLMMSLISVISATHVIGTQVLIGNKHNEFYQNPAINHALVGDSGSGKSIIFRSLVKKPLNALRKAERKRFAEQSQQYERSLAAWQKSDQSTPQPEPPPPINKMYLTGATLEGLKDYIAKAPDYSILNVVDELSGLFKGFNQYKQGQGNDRQEFLSLYDGDGFSEAKVSKNIFVEKSNTAWLGGLQPTILDKYFQLGASDGLLPRFTFSILPETIRLLPEENAQSIDVTGIVKGLYKATLDCQPQTYHITGEAYKYFREVDTKWQYEAARLPNGALKEFLKKCKGLLGRLSLNLHLTHELSDRYCGTPPTVIPLIRVKQAADIVEHLLEQIQAVHLQIAGETTQSAILAIINLSMKRQSLGEEGWLNAREISRNRTAKGRMKTVEIRELMIKARDMGYGQLRGTGTKLEFRSRKNVGDLYAIVEKAHKPDTSVVLNSDPPKMSADVGDLSAIIKNPAAIEKTGGESIEFKNVGNVGDFSDVFEVLDESELIVSDKNIGELNLLFNPSVVNANVVNPHENSCIISPTTPTTPIKIESLAESITNTNVESADLKPTNLPTIADNRRQNSLVLQLTTDENSISDSLPTIADNRRQSPLLPITTTDDNCQQNEEQESSTEQPQPTTNEPQSVITDNNAVRNVCANAALVESVLQTILVKMIDSFLQEWSDKFKAAVWAELTLEQRKAVK